jgi:hypothetical protein
MRRVLLLLVCIALSACGGNDGSGAPRQLTQDEASRLAGAAFLNHRSGGSAFEVTTLSAVGGQRLTLSGVVDWSHNRGVASVDIAGGGSTLVAVAWEQNVVAERRPADEETLAREGLPPGAWIGRLADQRRRIDQVIAVVTGLATKRPENAVLIRQEEGSSFMRNDTLRGTAVEVLRYGQRSIFWIDVATGRMLRFEGNDTEGTLPIIVDFLPHITTAITPPGPEDVVSLDEHPGLLTLVDGP